jgi:vibriolysin
MKQGFNLSKLPLIIGATLLASSINTSANEVSSMVIKNQTDNGAPSFVIGELGSVTPKTSSQALKNIINSQSEFGAQGNEDFQIRRQWVDDLGKSHTHFDQTINGIKVYGTSMIMHANTSVGVLSVGNEQSSIYGVTGRLAHNQTPVMASALSGKSAKRKLRKATAAAKKIGKVLGEPELSYVYLPLTEETKLSYRIEVSYDNDTDGFGRDFIYFDAGNFEVVSREPQVHSAKSWRTHTLNGGTQNSAPGTLLCTNNQSCGGNAAAQRAHDGAATVYDYYQSRFGRDSLDNNGMTLVSSVDLGGDPNAYWTGYQMMYGQASSGLNDFTADFDIIGHELTHGVTTHTANLVYQGASGALNEAWSDIMGVTSEAYNNGTTSSSWLIGDGLYNNQPGKAFRYMANPTQDNYSKDWWPERIPFNSGSDNGGVHGNSGIANLAFVLLVDGGTHPRNKSNAQVPGIGMAKAEQIFYRALSTYMNQSTNFSGARTATAQAAQDLYGATEKFAVETAWCAVGVGTCPTGGGPTEPPTGDNVLQNGVAKTGLSASTGSDIVFTMDVPAGATNINFVASGGTGDADMYVKFGATPTDSNWDCRPYKSGNNESCSGTSTGGTYYVRLKAYQSFSGVSLTGSYTGGTTPPPPPPPPSNPPITEQVTNVSVAGGQWNRFWQDIPAGYSNMTISISGGYGDADLYIRHGSQSTFSNFDCRPYKGGNNETCSFTAPAAGRWYIDIYGYQSASGITLNLQANP